MNRNVGIATGIGIAIIVGVIILQVEQTMWQQASVDEYYEKGGKVAFTSRSSPEKIENAESYLTSRFQSGMLTEIKPIDDDTTAKIIKKLALDINLILPENIIHFLLSRIPRDFSSIKDSVSALNRESYLQKKKVTLSLVKKTLKIF